MKKFIAYFDYLGFKQFIDNNDSAFQRRIILNNLRDIESALGKGKIMEVPHGIIADLSNSIINCLNFSDTVVFWSNDASDSSLLEILEVAYRFNWQAIGYFFPVRGSLVYGEIDSIEFKHNNEHGGTYKISSVYGKGLIKAHLKAEKQNWTGTVLDKSLIEELSERGYFLDTFLKPYAKLYRVPYKAGIELSEEYVLKIVDEGLDDEAFQNYAKGIRENFAQYNKSTESEDVKKKIENTISYLKCFCK